MDDVMERQPHKRPDDDLARINKEHLAKLDVVVAQVDGMGEHSYSDVDTIENYARYCEVYADALHAHYDQFEADTSLHREHPDRDNDAQNFVDTLIRTNEEERIDAYVTARSEQMDAAHAEEFKSRLPLHFGTMRNQYLLSLDRAGMQISDFMAAGLVSEPNQGRGKK